MPTDLKKKVEVLTKATSAFLKAAADIEERAIVILPGLVSRETDRATVVTNWNVSDLEIALSAAALFGPLVEDNHAIKCATIASLMGQEEAERCAKCERRGLAPLLQDQFEDGPDEGPDEMH